MKLQLPLPFVLLVFTLVGLLSPVVSTAQNNPVIKIDGNSVSADPERGIKLPTWLTEGQTLAADQDVYSISVIEFTENGTALDFARTVKVTTVETVPAGKTWKIESVHFQSSLTGDINWNLTGNAGTTAGADFMGTTDGQALVFKTNNVEAMRMTTSGDVGIGTASPATKLHVQGTVRIADGTQGENKVLTSDASGNASWGVGLLPGMIMPYAGATPPAGYLECNGAAVSRTTYASLFAVIGTMYGAGDGATTFNLPDYRGQFLRGWNHGASADPDAGARTNRGDGTTGDNVGTKQDYQVQSHNHAANGVGNNEFVYVRGGSGVFGTSGGSDLDRTTVPVQAFGGSETRPKNINVMYLIKH